MDDQHVIADTLAAILRNAGLAVSVAYDAQSAIAECECSAPDLIISDVAMPGMNGIEMAVAIRQRYPGCKILLFSGHAVSVDLLG